MDVGTTDICPTTCWVKMDSGQNVFLLGLKGAVLPVVLQSSLSAEALITSSLIPSRPSTVKIFFFF